MVIVVLLQKPSWNVGLTRILCRTCLQIECKVSHLGGTKLSAKLHHQKKKEKEKEKVFAKLHACKNVSPWG